jgi:hypothetical protein
MLNICCKGKVSADGSGRAYPLKSNHSFKIMNQQLHHLDAVLFKLQVFKAVHMHCSLLDTMTCKN